MTACDAGSGAAAANDHHHHDDDVAATEPLTATSTSAAVDRVAALRKAANHNGGGAAATTAMTSKADGGDVEAGVVYAPTTVPVVSMSGRAICAQVGVWDWRGKIDIYTHDQQSIAGAQRK